MNTSEIFNYDRKVTKHVNEIKIFQMQCPNKNWLINLPETCIVMSSTNKSWSAENNVTMNIYNYDPIQEMTMPVWSVEQSLYGSCRFTYSKWGAI